MLKFDTYGDFPQIWNPKFFDISSDFTRYGNIAVHPLLQPQPLGAVGPPTVTPPPGGAVQPNPCAATPPGAPDAAARQPDELPYNPSPNPNRWGRWAPHCNPTPWGSRAAQPLCSYTPWRRCVAQPLCSYNLQPHPATGFPCRRPARPNLLPLPILACQCQPDTGLPCLPYLFCMQKLFT